MRRWKILIIIAVFLSFLALCNYGIRKVRDKITHRSNCSLDVDLHTRNVEFHDLSGNGVFYYWVHKDKSTTISAVGQSRLRLNGERLAPGGYHVNIYPTGWELELFYFDIQDGTPQEIASQVQSLVEPVLIALELPTDQFSYDMTDMQSNSVTASEVVYHPDDTQFRLRYSSMYFTRGDPKLEILVGYVDIPTPEPWQSEI